MLNSWQIGKIINISALLFTMCSYFFYFSDNNLESNNGKIESWLVSDHQPLYVNTPPKPIRQVVESPEIVPKRICPEPLIGDNPVYLQYPARGQLSLNPHANMSSYPHNRPINQIPYRNNHMQVKYEQNPFIYASPISHNKPPETSKPIPPFPANPMNNYVVRMPFGQNNDKDNPQTKIFPPRPHSADFLEHDYKGSRQVNYQNETLRVHDINKLQRPKSSLDVIRCNDYCYDSLHWSEEAYAEKMRQTSLYVTPHFRSHDKNNIPVANFLKEALPLQNMDQRYTQEFHETR